MSSLVVDASVVVKWFIPEVYGASARQWLNTDRDLCAPDLLWAEVGNVLWKKWRQGELDQATGRALLADLQRLPLQTYTADSLLDLAWLIATQTGRSVYDSLYLALAVQLDSPLVTADLRFFNALLQTPLARQLVWVEDTSDF